MNSEYAYGVDDSERAHLVPNLRIVASQPFIGLTAYIGGEPHLVIAREAEDTYLMEDQFGELKRVDFVFPWEMPKVESNKLVAASRTAESPFRNVGLLYYDEETGEWAVRVGSSNMRYPLEEKIASLEEQGWSKFADMGGPSGVDVGGDFGHGHSGPSHGEHPGAGEHAPTIEVRAACPHCHSDQHLELASDGKNHPHSDENKYVCHNCGKWSLEHELEVSDHDKNKQDQNPEDVSYEEHDDDAERHQDPNEEREVHDDSNKFDVDDSESEHPKKKHARLNEALSLQGPSFGAKTQAVGLAVKPESQSREEIEQMIANLRSSTDLERDYVNQRYQEQGTKVGPFYDNPFINRGGNVREADTLGDRLRGLDPRYLPQGWEQHYGPGELDEPFELNNLRLPSGGGEPTSPQHFQREGLIIVCNELQQDDAWLYLNPTVYGILMSRGGPGSHAVYVAGTMRGLPCILISAAEEAAIDPGDHLTLDGVTGVVHVNGGQEGFQAEDQDVVRNRTDYDVYRFAYANGQGHVEQMVPGQMTGDKGGHQGMIGMLMSSGHAQIDPETYEHNATYGFFTKNGVIVQDIHSQIPDQEQFVNWAHAEETALGLPRGPVRREDISAYGVTYGPPGVQNAEAPAAAPAPAEQPPTEQAPPQTLAYITNEDLGSGGPKTDKAITCPHCGSHTIEQLSRDEDKGKAEWLCLTCDNTFKADYRRTAAHKHPKGTRVEVTHPAKKGLKGSVVDHAGTDEGLGDDLYNLLLDNGDELPKVAEIHFKVIKSASIKTAAHIKTYLPNNSWHNGCSMLAGKAGLEGQIHYPLTGQTLPIVGAGMPNIMQTFLPEHANLGGNNNIPIDVDVNDPEKFWQIWEAPGEGGGGGENRHREEGNQNVSHIVVIAALHDEVADYAQMIAHSTDQDPDEIAADMADKGMIHSDEEWTEVRELVNHARGKNPHALSSLQKGAPYPEKSYHNAPNHSPKGQDWPAEVNAVYNACMREGGKEKSSCAAIAWAQYHKSVKEHGHGTSEAEGKSREGTSKEAWMPNTPNVPNPPNQNANPNAANPQGSQTPPCPHCGSPTNGTPNYYWCPSCGWTSQDTSTPGGGPGVPGNAPDTAAQAPPAQTYHSHLKSAALSVGEWYTMYSPDYKVPDVIQVVDVNDQGVTANIEGDDKGLFPITLEHGEIERAGYKFEPYSNPSEVKTARRSFTVKEQNDLVNENLEGQARNFHKLNLEGTHYPQATEASVDPLNEDLFWW